MPILSASVSINSGIALEYIVELSIRQNSNPWLNIPVLADDDYVMQFASFLYANLPPKFYAIIEYSNEIWNGVSIIFSISIIY